MRVLWSGSCHRARVPRLHLREKALMFAVCGDQPRDVAVARTAAAAVRRHCGGWWTTSAERRPFRAGLAPCVGTRRPASRGHAKERRRRPGLSSIGPPRSPTDWCCLAPVPSRPGGGCWLHCRRPPCLLLCPLARCSLFGHGCCRRVAVGSVAEQGCRKKKSTSERLLLNSTA